MHRRGVIYETRCMQHARRIYILQAGAYGEKARRRVVSRDYTRPRSIFVEDGEREARAGMQQL